MTASVLTGAAPDLTVQNRHAPDPKTLIQAKPCHGHVPLVFAPERVCVKCGRSTRPVGPLELAILQQRENLAVLSAAVDRARRELNMRVHDETGCESFRELMAETHWLRDAQRAGWVPS